MTGMRGSGAQSPSSIRPQSAGPTVDKLTSAMVANEELRSRNMALINKNAQMEEALVRMTTEPPGLAAVAERAAPSAHTEALNNTRWQFLDIALQGAARSRAEARRAHSETLIALDRSFGLRDDGRMKARALLAQSSRASSRLQAALQQLESEAAGALDAHNSDAAAWAARMRLVSSHGTGQLDAVVTCLRLELEKAEQEHASHARKLEMDNDRLEVERAEERGWSKIEVRRLAELLESQNSNLATQTSQANQSQTMMTADARRLRQNVAKLESELEQEKAAHAADSHRYSELVTQLQQANAKLREEVGSLSAELEQTREDLNGKLDKLRGEKESGSTALKTQLGQLQRSKESEGAQLRMMVDQLKIEKEAATASLHERLIALQADREADAKHLHGKIERLKQVQNAALAAGSARGRALLYSESLKSPDLMQHSTMTWRGEDWQPVAGSESIASLHNSPLQYEYVPGGEM